MSVDMKKLYSVLNEKLIELNDQLGVKRSVTMPYVQGESMDSHIKSLGTAVAQAGGMANNLILTKHHSDGKGWGSGDGHSVAHPVQKLQETLIPEGDEKAVAVIDAVSTYLKAAEKLLGEDNPLIQQAMGQLAIVKKTGGRAMNLFDFNVFMTNLVAAPTQAIGKAHSGNKEGGHHPLRRAPREGQQSPAETPGQPQGEGEAQPAQATGPAAPAAPGAQGAPPPEAQAAPAAPAAPAQS